MTKPRWKLSEWKVNTDVSSVTLLLSLRASQLLALPPFPSPVVFSKREDPTWEAAVTAPAGGEVPSPGKSTASVWVHFVC